MPNNDDRQPVASTSYLHPSGIQNKKSVRPLPNLTGEITKDSASPWAVACGGFADVYKALWNSEQVGSLIYCDGL